ncbi:BMP-binding endothelial regulator protein-like [Oppia nitens]|uniref:BMP-binding endothelial regulator protein-like n=1 Tax=Oppia nitens TaxID=1686743 RepID=UPI0023D98DB7|nr:BMP-binding endothelial regulator protein-like [Oppia nitens]
MSIFTYYYYYSVSTCLLLLTILLFGTERAQLSSASQSLRGDVIKCQNEGERVRVSLLSDDPCITCKCFNREVVCQREVCTNYKGCYLLYYGKNRTCCDVCKGCQYDGQYYKSGDKFVDSADKCRTVVCNSGVITKYTNYCHIPCDNPIKIDGQCCPSCAKCETNGNNGRQTIASIYNATITDPCVKCDCVGGNMICTKPACPVLPCPQSKWFIPPNECCPICKGHRKVHDFEGNCIMGLKTYRNGQTYDYDQCSTCVCNSTTNICERQVCPTLDCPPMYQITELGECCPKCHEPQEVQTTCSYRGKEYKTGEKWMLNKCSECSCVNGEVRCKAKTCDKDLVCPKRYKLIRLSGDCCRSCVEEDAVCKITNNLTHYQTFDGREYNYSGKCNYILARDCTNKAFSVHIVNKYHNKTNNTEFKNNSSFFTGSTIMVKIDDIKVRLGQSAKVTVGRKRVRLPHIRLGILSVVQELNKVIIRANIGIKVIWESGNSVEILVPPEFKSKTCGLCGNYNNDPNDDFLTKRGKIYTEVNQFIHSWKVGKNVICESAVMESMTKSMKSRLKCGFKDWEQRHNAINTCNILKSALFRQCHTSVSITPYFGKCLSDVCSCHKNNVCHCTAIQSYANQCQKLGFYSQHWKKKILCDAMKCPSGSTFSTCTSQCKRTCQNSPNNNNNNTIIDNNNNTHERSNCRKRKCRPGCECPIGQVWHNGQCIYKQLCPRVVNNNNNNTYNNNNNVTITGEDAAQESSGSIINDNILVKDEQIVDN